MAFEGGCARACIKSHKIGFITYDLCKELKCHSYLIVFSQYNIEYVLLVTACINLYCNLVEWLNVKAIIFEFPFQSIVTLFLWSVFFFGVFLNVLIASTFVDRELMNLTYIYHLQQGFMDMLRYKYTNTTLEESQTWYKRIHDKKHSMPFK